MQKNLRLPLLLLALIASVHAFYAQTDYSTIDARAREVAFPKGQNTNRLATDLTANLKTEKEKVRAIFVWITDNIKYDIKTAMDEDAEAETVIEKQIPVNVLKAKKAVCAGYANLFDALCAAACIASLRVNGLSKNNRGRVSRIGHAWNVVRTDGDWGLIDATWGAGGVDEDDRSFTPHFNEQFFLGTPDVFLLNHYPDDPLFQLRSNPMDLPTFKLKPEERATAATEKKTAAPVMFPSPKDSLNAFVALDSNARQMNSWSRMLRFDPNDGYANFYLARYHYNIAVEYFNAYTAEMNRLSLNRLRPTLAIWKNLSEILSKVHFNLDKAQQFASNVQPGHKTFRSNSMLRREVDSKQKICANAQKRVDDMKAGIKE